MNDTIAEGWTEQARPPALFRRFAFERYAQTRAFLERVAAVQDELGLAPQNISFGTTYVNVTIAASGEGGLGEAERELARRIAAAADACA
ncbi:MAG: 4a-hydroxytetrahydrobiopterin dehydratase [Tepidimonas sp.]|uniref:4a-hydroxytetrahydrobiopterin dehydratase n=1 Tax=Tepidimonas sp. TaxID=2002775 RepID=UPI00298EDA44|nr:4a-hydroxytetrahydrobiopterin dehydratase [Tepidimonas sp.]MCS6811728.1 4a-hydroxytetrahydrobiopterin dehydratase [Tepidimonas sp.]MCX7742523.1 4a-hydroxytetrahydrobiopterin dehydratase [Tepidimonas sp.]MDW8336121.1 4a-hydroxytetrahydrobiopterin dehydratase [Tepidimonas sp.]